MSKVFSPIARYFLLALFTAANLVYTSSAHADDAFYKNKRLTILINFAVGGPTDIEGRLFAKYIGRHIDGQPTVIVQNMDGAGGIVGAKYLGEVAPNDGSVVGYFTGTAFMYALDPARFRTDFKSYEFVATQSGTTVHFMRTDVPPGMKDATDIAKAQGVIGGGLSVETPKDLRMRLALDMLGVPFKYVTGYRSSPPARLALQKGEINMFSESPPSYRSVVEPGLVKTGLAIPVFYDAYYNGGPFHGPSQMEGLSILPFHELYRKIKGTLPSGQLWDNYSAITAADGTMQRTIVFPPGTSQAARAALAAAVVRLGEDKAHAEEAMKSIGFVPDWETGADTSQRARAVMSIDPAVRSFLAGYIKAANK
jgi:tripartite-type tricarboxylate transporter receptor subunit TctC